MTLPLVVYILTALAALVIVLTRLRLRATSGAGKFMIGRGLVNVHTGVGLLALVVWIVFLTGSDEGTAGSAGVGIVALALWWIVVVVGLLMLTRWMPARGRHASSARRDGWGSGPALSILAHVGMLAGVLVFSWAYLTSAV